MKKILLSVSALAFLAVLTVTATNAYFTDREVSEGNTFTAGTLDIDLRKQNTNSVFQSVKLATNWAPGETQLVEFDVHNRGSLPVNIAGFALGEWEKPLPNLPTSTGPVPTIDNKLVKIVKVEAWIDGGWKRLVGNGNDALSGAYYYSPSGQSHNLYEVDSGQRAQLRLTAKFDESADNNYQGATYIAEIQVSAKQTNAPVSSFDF